MEFLISLGFVGVVFIIFFLVRRGNKLELYLETRKCKWCGGGSHMNFAEGLKCCKKHIGRV